ncbi:MAG: hypothetical protein M1133_12055 [Armatimonadetes bacterium]|nr:hypothetical protein [Armatimonadota bacterium]
MNTVDMLKKSLAFTIGAAELSAEKLRSFADEMVQRGEVSKEDAKKFVDDVSRKADDEKKSIQDWMREQASKMLQQAGAAEAARVDKLEERVAALEKRLAEMSKAAQQGATD